MNIGNVYTYFCNEIVSRTNIITEDNIRYYWFLCMHRLDKTLNNYTLEQPYSQNPLNITTLPKKEMDLLYQGKNEYFCFEIKFHRKGTSTALPHTSAAGELFDDLQRLQQIPPFINEIKTNRYLLYVTDDEMHNYFTSKRTKDPDYDAILKDFYTPKTCPVNLDFSKSPNTPKSFLKSANGSFPQKKNPIQILNLKLINNNDLSCKNSSLISGQLHVRLYEI